MRIDYIVFLRVIATLAVLINHVPLVADHVFRESATRFDDEFTGACVSLVHWAVPIFVMITGALLLDKKREISFEIAIKKYLWRIAVVLLVVGGSFALMEEYSNTRSINLSLFYTSFVNVLIGKSWTHMWYLYMLLGLYLVTPFLKMILNTAKLRDVDALILLLFFSSSLMFATKHFFDFQIGIDFPVHSIYILYMLLGWRVSQIDEIHSQKIKKNSFCLLLLVVLLSLLLLVANHYYYEGCEKFSFCASYNSPLEVILGISIFLFCYVNKGKFSFLVSNKIVKMIDNQSFGVYVFHMLWLNILYKVVGFNPLEYNPMVYILILFVVLLLSMATTCLFRKLPKIGKFI